MVAALGSAPDRADASAAAVGAEVGCGALEELLEQPIDVVHVCAPNRFHFSTALAAIEAGKHVVCEKPLAVEPDEADRLLDAARAAGLVHAIPFVYRFHPLVREMRERILRGDTGGVSLIQGSYLQDWLAEADEFNWRIDSEVGGPSRVFADIGSHWFDLMEFVTGDRVARLSAQFATLNGTRRHPVNGLVPVRTEDTATVQFTTRGGVVGTFSASQVARGRKNRLLIEVSGAEESFAFDQERPEELWVGDARGHRTVVKDPNTLGDDARRLSVLPAGHAQGYQDCFNGFVRDVYAKIGGADPAGLPDFSDGARSARLVQAALQSSSAGGAWIEGLHATPDPTPEAGSPALHERTSR